MIRSFIGNFVQDICNHNGYSEEQCEQIQYTTTVFFFELVKLMTIILVFSLYGYWKESIIIIGIMCLTKPFIGGYHEDTQIKCFIATMLITTSVILLSLNCKLNFISNSILILISLFSIYNTAPVLNNKMPITRLELIKKNRVLGISISSVLAISSILLYKYSGLYEIITWTILFQSILMFNKRQNK
ncbi:MULTISPECIES: accessory gene regulator B family protein [unclassified Clostridium]|uniref:Accessory gene regulator protein B n=1 Tax=Clostridium botulinum (strain Eklund 17B / Type B) TaxID=935198 RepID=B2TL91_CLOBB|nr:MULTISPECIES: accessory gene regulator B family protein [unclassified Clostridium]ACD25027.1 accessory gene regulator protein B [Clostridium botulinum B str. Eklund 17B (NRP)]MBN1051072.1 accessory regulator AgrB [Clostridium botulinum]MBY6976609.1 accessory gene regulator B family protein [Clostridium botulinum]MBY7001458.1 accessory gene regulator B family protein [Clostridium botulinum]MCR1274295.1 accessory gene regulator B family protein [Clostridium botulinum]